MPSNQRLSEAAATALDSILHGGSYSYLNCSYDSSELSLSHVGHVSLHWLESPYHFSVFFSVYQKGRVDIEPHPSLLFL